MRERTDAKAGGASTETTCGVTSVPSQRAAPVRLLAWYRGHWQVEHGNHRRRGAGVGEDAALPRPPANHATINNIVLAVVFHTRFRYPPEADRHCMMRCEDAAILAPD